MDFYGLLVEIKKLRPRSEYNSVCVTFSYDIRFDNFVITAVNYIDGYKKSIDISAFDLEGLEDDVKRNQMLEKIIECLVHDVMEVKL